MLLLLEPVEPVGCDLLRRQRRVPGNVGVHQRLHVFRVTLQARRYHDGLRVWRALDLDALHLIKPTKRIVREVAVLSGAAAVALYVQINRSKDLSNEKTCSNKIFKKMSRHKPQ